MFGSRCASWVASLYAAETDPQKIHQNLEDEIRTVLIDLIDEKETGSKP